MSDRFARKWGDRRPKKTLAERLKETARPSRPLKPRLNKAIKRLEIQIQKLDQAGERFSRRDKSIFEKIVKAYTKHDMTRANVFANELAEIRRMEKVIMHTGLALEQIVLRLHTVSELGDVVSNLGPIVKVLGVVRSGMANIFPEADREFGQIGDILGGIMIEAGQSTGTAIDFNTANEDANKILTEASAVAEQKIKEKLPDLPAEIPPPPIAEKTSAETS